MDTLLIVVALLVVGGYAMYRLSRENANLKATVAAKTAAVRDIVPDLDEHLLTAQSFAATQDDIANDAEEARLAAVRLAADKAQERATAQELARKKRDNISLI